MKKFLINLKSKFKLEKSSKSEIRLQNEKYKYVSTLRIVSIFVIGGLLATLVGTALFVYLSITNTIGQVQSIELYQSGLHVELINFKKLNDVEKKWDEKYKTDIPKIERNPFLIVPLEELPELTFEEDQLLITQ